MKLKLFMKSKKFQNSWTIVLSALLIIVGLIEFFNPTSTDKTVSIFAYIPYVFGVILCFGITMLLIYLWLN